MRRSTLFVFVIINLLAATAQAANLRVFACESEWAALTMALGGKRVAVTSATSPSQDPHRIEPRPGLIAAVRRADLLVCTGAGLEAGWLERLVASAHNPQVTAGSPGQFLASQAVALKEVPSSIDRSAGDVHAEGNPHFASDPRLVLTVARALTQRLIQLDPQGQADYAAHAAAFSKAMQTAMQRWQEQAKPLAGTPVIQYHRRYIYLIDWLGMQDAGTLEPKPGVPPGPGDLQAMLTLIETHPTALLVHASYDDPSPLRWLARQGKVRAVELPAAPEPRADGLQVWYAAMVGALLQGAKAP